MLVNDTTDMVFRLRKTSEGSKIPGNPQQCSCAIQAEVKLENQVVSVVNHIHILHFHAKREVE